MSQRNITTITVVLEIDVDERQWAYVYGMDDAYDRAEVRSRRSLVADVQYYVAQAIQESGAANEGCFTEVCVIPGGEPE